MPPKTLNLIIHTLPLLLGVVFSYFFWRNNSILLIIYLLAALAVIWVGRDRRTEFLVFIYGAVIGFLIETIGTQVSGYQSFANPQILGIPGWLVVAWGYGFVLMKRIGLVITQGTPWTK